MCEREDIYLKNLSDHWIGNVLGWFRRTPSLAETFHMRMWGPKESGIAGMKCVGGGRPPVASSYTSIQVDTELSCIVKPEPRDKVFLDIRPQLIYTFNSHLISECLQYLIQFEIIKISWFGFIIRWILNRLHSEIMAIKSSTSALNEFVMIDTSTSIE